MELTKEQIERQDLVDNAIYDFMLKCSKPVENHLTKLFFNLDPNNKFYNFMAREAAYQSCVNWLYHNGYSEHLTRLQKTTLSFRAQRPEWNIELISEFRIAVQEIFVGLKLCTALEFYPYLQEQENVCN